MASTRDKRIVLTHWNAGVFYPARAAELLPELVIYSLLYDEVLIREEDLLTNRVVTRLLSDPKAFAIFSELLIAGYVKLLRLPLGIYPPGRRFDPIRLPISARVEEHQVRRTMKGNPWTPTQGEWALFQKLDFIVATYPSASRYHAPFAASNPFAAQLGEILENRESYRLGSHPVFRYLNNRTADQFIVFCQDPEAWRRFLRERGVANPIVGPDAGFYRSAAYQCAKFLPTPRAIRRLFESVYAATYCEREFSDGRYGGSELVELPYRYASDFERAKAGDEALRIEVAPTGAAADIVLEPGIASVLARVRQTPEFLALRRSVDALGSNEDSPLLSEARFQSAWQNLCTVYSEHSAVALEPARRADHRIFTVSAIAYVLARVVGFVLVPNLHHLEVAVAEDAVAIAAMEKLGPRMLRSLRGLVKIPALRRRMESSLVVRCSTVPLNVSNDHEA